MRVWMCVGISVSYTELAVNIVGNVWVAAELTLAEVLFVEVLTRYVW